MLNQTLEFLRIADTQPTDEKVLKRTESAQALLDDLAKNRDILLDFVQGIVAGFTSAPFTQESQSVVLLIKAIKDRGTLPQDLKENAVELRAVAAIALGELLTHQPQGIPTDESILAALSFRSALSLRPPATEKHIRWMLDTLLNASDAVLQLAAQLRRKRGTPALQQLAGIAESATPAKDLWTVVVPAVKAALRESTAQAAIDREEVETLWWMFTAYSEVGKKPLAGLEPAAAAFCSGVELAQRALLPPALSAVAMVARAVESGRKTSALGAVSLQDAAKDWSQTMLDALSPADESWAAPIQRYPALLPLSWACHRLRECKNGTQKLGKEFTAATGIPSNHSCPPAEWGAQVFREKILQRVLTDNKED